MIILFSWLNYFVIQKLDMVNHNSVMLVILAETLLADRRREAQGRTGPTASQLLSEAQKDGRCIMWGRINANMGIMLDNKHKSGMVELTVLLLEIKQKPGWLVANYGISSFICVATHSLGNHFSLECSIYFALYKNSAVSHFLDQSSKFATLEHTHEEIKVPCLTDWSC